MLEVKRENIKVRSSHLKFVIMVDARQITSNFRTSLTAIMLTIQLWNRVSLYWPDGWLHFVLVDSYHPYSPLSGCSNYRPSQNQIADSLWRQYLTSSFISAPGKVRETHRPVFAGRVGYKVLNEVWKSGHACKIHNRKAKLDFILIYLAFLKPERENFIRKLPKTFVV